MISQIIELLEFVFSSFWVWFGMLIYLLVITRDMNKIVSHFGRKISSFYNKVMDHYRRKSIGVTNGAAETTKAYTGTNRSYVPKT